MILPASLTLSTRGRGTYDLTAEVDREVRAGRLALGTWQGLYLYEHRTQAHPRRVLLTISGEPA